LVIPTKYTWGKKTQLEIPMRLYIPA
jgi:hypothetical protein